MCFTPTVTARLRLVNSAVAFALACLVMITLHELAHVVTGVAQGNAPVLYGFAVDDRSATEAQHLVTVLAGPVFSLVTGLLVLSLPVRSLPVFWHLAVLWFGLVSVQEFSGYLITGPFAHVGDIGSALEITDAPAVVGWFGFLLGWVITYLLGGCAVRRLSWFLTAGEPVDPQLRDLGLFAWLLAAAAVIVVSLGLFGAGGVSTAEAAFIALGVATTGIFLVFVRLFLPLPSTTSYRDVRFGFPALGLVVFVLVAVARQVAMSGGVRF